MGSNSENLSWQVKRDAPSQMANRISLLLKKIKELEEEIIELKKRK